MTGMKHHLDDGKTLSLIEAGLAHMRSAEWPEARRMALMAIAAAPENTTALTLLGEAELNDGRPERAWAPLTRVVRLGGQFVHHILYATCLRRLGQWQEAAAQREKAAGKLLAVPVAYFLLGDAYALDGDHARAATLFQEALARDPEYAPAHHRRGASLLAMGDADGARHHFQAACRLRDDNPDYFTDLSSAYSALGRFDEARHEAEHAIAMREGNRVAYHNLGHALLNLNRSADAVSAFDRALALGPNEPRTRFSRATALLKAGRFAEGWREYEYRWLDCQTPRTDISAPLWLGEDVAGKAVLLHGEQGFGDSLQFVRLAARVAERGATVYVQVAFPLVRLFQRTPGIAAVFSVIPDELSIDFHLPMASLPLRVGLGEGGIPSSPYLDVDPDEVVRQGGAVRQRLGQGAQRPDLLVGLVWAGDARKNQPRANLVDRRRSMGLTDLAPLFSVAGIRFVSFQLGEAGSQIGEGGYSVSDATVGILDFADTAARLHGVDLLVSVDTSIVHLAGGLGLPVWMISRFDACWRWLEGRADTPWYPSMRIFRQQAPGDWSAPVNAVRSGLDAWSRRYAELVADSAHAA